MTDNAKNKLHNLLKELGHSEDLAEFKNEFLPNSKHRSTVIVRLPDGREVEGTGEEAKKTDADIAASKVALDKIYGNQSLSDLRINWDEIYVEAQRGDALIKLGVYVSSDFPKSKDKSNGLQELESEDHLEKVFDCWKAKGDPDLSIFGDNLGKKRKTTLVEALLW